jgi:hypothetical protein
VALCHSTLLRLQLQPPDAGFWTVCEPMLAMGGQWPGLAFDLESLRPRFAGSLLWMSLLDTAFVLHAADGDWPHLLALADEMWATAQAPKQHRFSLCGTWHRAVCQAAMDQTPVALHTLAQFIDQAHDIAWDHGAVLGWLMTAQLHLCSGESDTARACHQAAVACSQQASQEARSVLLPLLHIRILLQQGHTAAAVLAWQALPAPWLAHSNDHSLSTWAETAAWLAAALHQHVLGQSLMTVARQLAAHHDQLAVVRRWRNSHFDPAPAWHAVCADDKQALRQRLNVALQHFNPQVPEDAVA